MDHNGDLGGVGRACTRSYGRQIRAGAAVVVAAAVVVLSSGRTSAFRSCHALQVLANGSPALQSILANFACDDPGHYEITKEGLGSLPAALMPSKEAIESVASADEQVDVGETTLATAPTILSSGLKVWMLPNAAGYDYRHHFDRPQGRSSIEAFQDAVVFLNDRRTAVIRLLSGPNACRNVPEALANLGIALHAVQDAYSHSSYTDSPLMLDRPAIDKSSFDAAVQNPATFLTSPRWPPGLLLTLYDKLYPSGDPENPNGTCTNGSPSEGNYCHRYYSKDAPGNYFGATGYHDAYTLAVTSTRQFAFEIATDPTASISWQPVVTYKTPMDVCRTLALSPDNGLQGQANLDVALTGQGTDFVSGATTADFGADVAVNGGLVVKDQTHATVNITIASSAVAGDRTVMVTTGQGSVTGFFTVVSTVPVLTQVSPDSSSPGQTSLGVMLTGESTHFVSGATVVDFGPGIATVGSASVMDGTHARATISVDPSALAGNRTVSVTTGSETVSLISGFTVTGPVRTTLLFDSDRGGRLQVYAQDLSAQGAPLGKVRQLTTAGAGQQESRRPSWSTDDLIAFQFGAPGTRGIHVIKSDGTANVRVTPPPSQYPCSDNRDPSWSPDGRRIAYACLANPTSPTSGGSYDIWLHDTRLPAGSPAGESQLAGFSTTLELAPAWSPDGRSLAFVTAGPGAKARIAKLDLASNRIDILTAGGTDAVGASTNFNPTWSPDSRQIAFSSTRPLTPSGPAGPRHIFVMNVQCPEFQQGCPAASQLTTSVTGEDTNPAWSPDGSMLAFVSTRKGKRQVFLIDPSRPENVTDNKAVRISDGKGNDDDPAWNPSFTDTLRVAVPSMTVAAGLTTPSAGTVTVTDNAGNPVAGADVTITVPQSGTGTLAFSASPGAPVVGVPLTGKTDSRGQLQFNAVEPSAVQQSSRFEFPVEASIVVNGNSISGLRNGSLYVLAIGSPVVPQIGIPNQRMPLGANPFSRSRKKEFGDLALENSRAALRGAVKDTLLATATTFGLGLVPAQFESFLGVASAGVESVFLEKTTLDYFLANSYLVLANDPPDPNFTTVALPSVHAPPELVLAGGSLTPATTDLLDRSASLGAVIRAYVEALVTSVNRYSTALSVNDPASAALQRDAILSYQDALSALFSSDADLTQAMLTALQSDGLPNVQLAPDSVTAILSGITANGLPTTMVESLQQLGLSGVDIAAIQSALIASDPQSLASDLFSLLGTEAQTARSSSAAFTVGSVPDPDTGDSVSGTFTYTPAAGTVLGAGSKALGVTFTPTDTRNFTTASGSTTLQVGKTPATVTLTGLAQVYDGTPKAVTATTDPAGLSVSVTYENAPAVPSAAGTYAVNAMIADPGYQGAASGALVISKATPTLTWPTPAPIVYGGGVGPMELRATASVPGTFAYSPGAGTVLGAGAQTLSVTFTPTDIADYAVASASVVLEVAKATPTITWANPADVTPGVPLSSAQLNASVNVPGALIYTPAAGTVLGAGLQTLAVAFTPTDAANYTSTSKTVTLNVLPVSLSTLSRFVALGVNQLWLRAKAKFNTGDVGANTSLSGRHRSWDRDDDGEKDATVEVRFGEQAAMLQPGSRVVGDTVWLRAGASVYDVLDNELVNRRATVKGTVSSSVSLPFVSLPKPPSITPGTKDVTVAQGGTMTLSPGNYRSVHIKQRGTLILTGGLYQALSLDLDDQATVLVRGASEVRIKGELDTGSGSRIVVDRTVAGLRASSVIIYVGGDDTSCHHDGRGPDGDNAGPTSVHIGEQNTVEANIFAPNGTIWLKARTVATGAFIGRQVRIGEGTQLTLDSIFK